eukprot:TRINITY_DN6144_c0_g1_i1.p1 TRINITY_DN6144_c0_g1~~TRINITY_DN6144_c0_g1_i1.p1  ORF type:complete len:662 (-),score=105.59 TRINITY_DN6144_c0_g1_i1:5-1957(-)
MAGHSTAAANADLLSQVEERKYRLTPAEVERCKVTLNNSGWVNDIAGLNKILASLHIPTENRDPEWQTELEKLFATPRWLDLPTLLWIVQEEKEIHVSLHDDASMELLNLFVSLGGVDGGEGVVGTDTLRSKLSEVDPQLQHALGEGKRLEFEEFIQCMVDDEELQQRMMEFQSEFRVLRRNNAVNAGMLEELIHKYVGVIPYEYIEQFIEGIAETFPKQDAGSQPGSRPHSTMKHRQHLHSSAPLPLLPSLAARKAAVEQDKPLVGSAEERTKRREARREERRKIARRGGNYTEVQQFLEMEQQPVGSPEQKADRIDALVSLHEQQINVFRRSHRIHHKKDDAPIRRPLPPRETVAFATNGPMDNDAWCQRKLELARKGWEQKIAEVHEAYKLQLINEAQWINQQELIRVLIKNAEETFMKPGNAAIPVYKPKPPKAFASHQKAPRSLDSSVHPVLASISEHPEVEPPCPLTGDIAEIVTILDGIREEGRRLGLPISSTSSQATLVYALQAANLLHLVQPLQPAARKPRPPKPLTTPVRIQEPVPELGSIPSHHYLQMAGSLQPPKSTHSFMCKARGPITQKQVSKEALQGLVPPLCNRAVQRSAVGIVRTAEAPTSLDRLMQTASHRRAALMGTSAHLAAATWSSPVT